MILATICDENPTKSISTGIVHSEIILQDDGKGTFYKHC